MPPKVSDASLAALADAVLELANQLDLTAPELRDLVTLTGTEIAVIREIHRQPRISPSALADLTGLKRSNVSAALRTLEARGLIVREHPASDGRTVELVATDLAEESLARIRAYWVERLRALPSSLLADGVAATRAIAAIAAAVRRPA